jgi:hypothetical protein
VLLSQARRLFGIPGYWSLSGYAKRRVKSAVSFIFDFEESVVRHVKDRGVDGVICGHIHAAAMKRMDGVVYMNCGDWVDSCTAIVEHMNGAMELVHWDGRAHPARSPAPETSATPAPLSEREESDATTALEAMGSVAARPELGPRPPAIETASGHASPARSASAEAAS